MEPPLNADVLSEIVARVAELPHPENCLYRCARTCRFLCKLSVPYLWRRPFSYQASKSWNVIRYVLAQLPPTAFAELVVKVGLADADRGLHQTAFAYASYVRHLNYTKLIEAAREWCADLGVVPKDFWLARGEEWMIIDDSEESPEYVGNRDKVVAVVDAVLALLEKHGVQLEGVEFNIEASTDVVFSTTLTNRASLLHDLKSVMIGEAYGGEKHFLNGLASVCKNLEEVRFIACQYSDDWANASKAFNSLVRSQRSVRTLVLERFYNDTRELLPALACQSSSLQHIEIWNAEFEYCGPLIDIASCIEVRDLRIANSTELNEVVIKPLAEATFPQLRRVEFRGNTVHTASCQAFLDWGKKIGKLVLINGADDDDDDDGDGGGGDDWDAGE